MNLEYRNPLRDLKSFARLRVDQGVDFAGSGPIYAIGPAVVEAVFARGDPSGWPGGGYVRYRFTGGPADGKHVYVAENVIPSVTPQQQIDSTTAVCTLVNASPNCEMGWASGVGTQTAHQGCGFAWNEVGHTAMGDNFNNLLEAIGAPTGIASGPLIGGLCPGFPQKWVISPPPPPPSENLMSLTAIDFKHTGAPKGRYRFVQLAPDDAHHQFRLIVRNGAKIAGHPTGALGVAVTQASNGKVLGIDLQPDGVHFVVTADDGGTFAYSFEA